MLWFKNLSIGVLVQEPVEKLAISLVRLQMDQEPVDVEERAPEPVRPRPIEFYSDEQFLHDFQINRWKGLVLNLLGYRCRWRRASGQWMTPFDPQWRPAQNLGRAAPISSHVPLPNLD